MGRKCFNVIRNWKMAETKKKINKFLKNNKLNGEKNAE